MLTVFVGVCVGICRLDDMFGKLVTSLLRARRIADDGTWYALAAVRMERR